MIIISIVIINIVLQTVADGHGPLQEVRQLRELGLI